MKKLTKQYVSIKNFKILINLIGFFFILNFHLKKNKKDLKKGLIKVMDKQYEPLIQALLTDMNENDVDRIYESLYVSLTQKNFIIQNKI